MIKPKTFLLLVVAFILSHATHAQLSSSEVDELVQAVINKFNLPGVAVGIVKDGEVIHSKGYGVKSMNSKEPMTPHSQINIASNTKAFTTAALAILVEQERISWQDKVVDHLPQFKMYNPYVTAEFTIEDLLTHRSGLGLGAGDLTFIPDGTNFTIDDLLTMFQHFEPQTPFRSEFAYDNILYMIAGELVQRVSGTSWNAFVKQAIFDPLKMDNTYGSLSAITNTADLATPHINDTSSIRVVEAFKDIKGAYGAGGIYSTTSDICKWMMMHLNRGKYGPKLDKELFSEQSQMKMWHIHSPYVTYPDERYKSHFSGYGLGWELRDMIGYKLVHNGGFITGMVSEIFLVPGLNLGIVTLINSSTPEGASPAYAIMLSVLDSYLGLEDNDWINKIYHQINSETKTSDSVVNAVWEVVENNNGDNIDAGNFIGVYEDAWFGKAEVFMNDGELWFKSYKSPKLNGAMRYYKASSFAVKWEYQDLNADAFVIFGLDEEGMADWIKLKGISPNIDFSFDFQDLNFKRIE